MTQAISGSVFRSRLRSAMPRVGILSGILIAIRLFVISDEYAETSSLGSLIHALAVLGGILTAGYYGPKAVRWLWRKLLWRVRRRLVITYLFVGLTPIVLMGSLGLLAGFIVSAESMARAIRQEVHAAESRAETAADETVTALDRVLPGTTKESLLVWVEKRGEALRVALPGARLAVWVGERGGSGAGAEPTDLVSVSSDEAVRPLGPDATPPGAPLPDWVRARASFEGLVFVRPTEGASIAFGSGSIRAAAITAAAGRPVAVLVTVPVSRALVARLREATRMDLHPYFLSTRVNVDIDGGPLKVKAEGNSPGRSRGLRIETSGGKEITEIVRKDQLGEPLPDVQYPALLTTVDWGTGETADRIGFIFPWSWSEAIAQIFGGTSGGRIWKIALLIVGAVFLGLELAALLAAVLITREVTGTVHELQLATEAVKRGDFSHRARKRSHDQLGELADAFNDMSEHIETLLDHRVERERLQREVEIAAEVQAKLFPRSVPDLKAAEITGECRAARGVAGDYYDYLYLAPGRIAIALADVSGKGISASLLMSNLQASLRAQAGLLAAPGADPLAAAVPAASGGPIAPGGALAIRSDSDGAVARLASTLNAQLCGSTDINRYATLFLALYDERSRLLRYTNAGHNAAVLVHPDGTVVRLSRGGTIVGAFSGAEYEEASVALQPGSVLVVFSDGISEAFNAREEEFGEERIAAFAVAHRHLPAAEIRQRLYEEVDRWSAGVERNDDQTLVILKHHPR